MKDHLSLQNYGPRTEPNNMGPKSRTTVPIRTGTVIWSGPSIHGTTEFLFTSQKIYRVRYLWKLKVLSKNFKLVEEFLKKLIIINVVCEPVHRVYSEFLHVTAKVTVKPLFPPLEGHRLTLRSDSFETVKARCRTIQYKCEVSWPWFNFISFQKFNFWWIGGGIYSGYQ